MPSTQRVQVDGQYRTFRSNATSATKGFVYVGGRRVYGQLADSLTGNPVFVPNSLTAIPA